MTAVAEPLSESAQLDELTRLNAHDLITAFKLDQIQQLRGLADAVARIPARRFSRQVLAFDRLVGEVGLGEASAYMLEIFARRLTITGQGQIPPSGPLLIVSNHPGMADVMAIWRGLAVRRDMRVIAAERPLLRVLPNICRYLMFVAEGSGSRTGLLRQAAAHLRGGGALLTFPAGRIEPDPSVRPGALTSLREWSSSVALFARQAPAALVLPAAVGGVISGTAMRNPLLRLLETQRERDWAAATLQVLIPAYRDTHTRVAFGEPIPAAELIALDDSAAITRAVTDRMAPLLRAVSGNDLAHG